MILENIKYCYKDLSIVPCEMTSLESRKNVNPFINNGMLPIFASPMYSVTNKNNVQMWKDNKITPIVPRTVMWNDRYDFLMASEWVAYSQKEFNNIFIDNYHKIAVKDSVFYVCIDTANAHRKSLYVMISKAKKIAKDNGYTLVVMVGNIANPATYRWICENAEVDYVRLGIGGGKGCITSTQTAVHYPMASLISECKDIKNDIEEDRFEFHQYTKCLPYIVADGGIRTNSDIITALALGADYVMCGSVLASLDESAAQIETDPETNHSTKLYFGMSTKKAQNLINAASENPDPNFVAKTSEGTVKHLEMTGSVAKWIDNFTDYLRSAMIYTGCDDIEKFTNNVNLVVKSSATTASINS